MLYALWLILMNIDSLSSSGYKLTPERTLSFSPNPLILLPLYVFYQSLRSLTFAFCSLFRLETSQRSLMAAQDEHKALSDLNDMLRRHNDNLKSQHDW